MRCIAWVIENWPNPILIMVVGKDKEAANEVQEAFSALMLNSTLLEGYDDLPRSFCKISEEEALFSIGSRVRFKPLTARVRCRGAHYLILDEIGRISEKQERELRISVYPVLKIRGSRNTVIMASVFGEQVGGAFYEATAVPNKIWDVSLIDYTQIPDEQTRADIELELKQHPEDEVYWRRNYMVEPPTTALNQAIEPWLYAYAFNDYFRAHGLTNLIRPEAPEGFHSIFDKDKKPAAESEKPPEPEKPKDDWDVGLPYAPSWGETADYGEQDLSAEEDRESGRRPTHRELY